MTLPAHRRQEGTKRDGYLPVILFITIYHYRGKTVGMTILLGLTALTLEKMNAVTTSGVGRADVRATGGHG
jgi:hypothetical protein